MFTLRNKVSLLLLRLLLFIRIIFISIFIVVVRTSYNYTLYLRHLHVSSSKDDVRQSFDASPTQLDIENAG